MLSQYPRRHYGRSHAAAALPAGPLTPAGAHWVAKALNPAHAELGMVSIPDAAAAVSALGEVRLTVNVQTNHQTPGILYDMDVVFINQPGVVAIWRTYNSGTPMTPAEGWNVILSPISAGVNVLDPQAVRNWARPIWTGIRSTYASVTAYTNSAALTNQGRVLAGQFPAPVYVEEVDVFTDTEALAARLLHSRSAESVGQVLRDLRQVASIGVVPCPPLTEQSIYEAGGQTYVGLAKAGVYMPLKFTGPIHPWVNIGETAVRVLFSTADGGRYSLPISMAPGINTQLGVLLYRGLDETTSVLLKFKQGWESTVTPGSLWEPFIESGSIDDPMALTAVAAAQQATAAAYPAAANDFLGILKSIGKALTGKVAKGISAALAQAGIPVVSTVAGGVNLLQSVLS